jgi:hypothetical protein
MTGSRISGEVRENGCRNKIKGCQEMELEMVLSEDKVRRLKAIQQLIAAMID